MVGAYYFAGFERALETFVLCKQNKHQIETTK